jgi:hypothetical protein
MNMSGKRGKKGAREATTAQKKGDGTQMASQLVCRPFIAIAVHLEALIPQMASLRYLR